MKNCDVFVQIVNRKSDLFKAATKNKTYY